MPEFGRFTSRDIAMIIHNTCGNIDELMPYIMDFDNLGNYTLAYGGLLNLAFYRTLLKAGVDPDYATNLIGDINWQFRLSSAASKYYQLRKKLAKLRTKDQMAFLGKYLQDALKFPYGEPGYRGKFYQDGDVFCMDFYSCAVHDFFKQLGPEEMTLFRKAQCTFDYAVAEQIADGLTYRREHTLSDGDEVCDQRWFFADSPEPASISIDSR